MEKDQSNEDLVPLSFPFRLMAILDDRSTDDVITWEEINERSFVVVKDTGRFVKEVLPRHFSRVCSFESFARKLRRWGFKREEQPKTSRAAMVGKDSENIPQDQDKKNTLKEEHPTSKVYSHRIFRKGGHRDLRLVKCCQGIPKQIAASRKRVAKSLKTEAIVAKRERSHDDDTPSTTRNVPPMVIVDQGGRTKEVPEDKGVDTLPAKRAKTCSNSDKEPSTVANKETKEDECPLARPSPTERQTVSPPKEEQGGLSVRQLLHQQMQAQKEAAVPVSFSLDGFCLHAQQREDRHFQAALLPGAVQGAPAVLSAASGKQQHLPLASHNSASLLLGPLETNLVSSILAALGGQSAPLIQQQLLRNSSNSNLKQHELLRNFVQEGQRHPEQEQRQALRKHIQQIGEQRQHHQDQQRLLQERLIRLQQELAQSDLAQEQQSMNSALSVMSISSPALSALLLPTTLNSSTKLRTIAIPTKDARSSGPSTVSLASSASGADVDCPSNPETTLADLKRAAALAILEFGSKSREEAKKVG